MRHAMRVFLTDIFFSYIFWSMKCIDSLCGWSWELGWPRQGSDTRHQTLVTHQSQLFSSKTEKLLNEISSQITSPVIWRRSSKWKPRLWNQNIAFQEKPSIIASELMAISILHWITFQMDLKSPVPTSISALRQQQQLTSTASPFDYVKAGAAVSKKYFKVCKKYFKF